MKNIQPVIFAIFCSLLVHLSKAQTSAVDNKLSKSITFHPIPKGPTVFGVFQGRMPCTEIARQLQLPTTADCNQLKWGLTLYQDPVTLQPTTYSLTIVGAGDLIKQEGGSYHQKKYEGKWLITEGMKSNPAAYVYRLDLGRPGANLFLLKGDAHVLFVLDENKVLRVGNEDFSYTLNRVELVPANK